MNKKHVVLILLLALSLSSCIPDKFEFVDKEKEAKLVEAQTQAMIAQSQATIAQNAASQNLAQDAAFHALEVGEMNEAIAERNAARKISIWATEYGKTAAIGLSVGAFFSLMVSLTLGMFATAAAYYKRSQLWAGLVYPDARGFLPVQIVSAGGQMVFAIDHNIGSVLRLDVSQEADRQRIKGFLEIQQTNRLAKSAGNPFNKNAGAFAEIMPESTPPSLEILNATVKDMILEQEGFE